MIQTKEELMELIERAGAANVKMIRFSSNLRFRNKEHLAIVEEIEFHARLEEVDVGMVKVNLDGLAPTTPEPSKCPHGVLHHPEQGRFFCVDCHKQLGYEEDKP